MSNLSFRRFAFNTGAILAVSATLAGVAYAALPKNSVNSRSVVDRSLQGRDIKLNTLTSSVINEATLTDVASVKNEKIITRKLPVAGTGINEAAARTAATPVVLLTQGQLSFYAKCFKDTAADKVYGEVYIKTTADGAMFNSWDDKLIAPGSLLDTGSLEIDRQIAEANAAANATGADLGQYVVATSTDRTKLLGMWTITVKNGTLVPTNGVFGTGDSCYFDGDINISKQV